MGILNMDATDIYSAFRSLENPSTPLDPYLGEGGDGSSSPVVVNDKTSKNFAPWWQGINVIASGVAQLPLITYRRLNPKGKERATDHPTYPVLHRRPNSELGPFGFKELMTMQCVSRGNAYAHIEKRGGSVRGLWPLPAGSVTPFRVNGDLRYSYMSEQGRPEVLRPENVFHLRGPSDDGLEGASVVTIARESLSSALQAQRYSHKFYKNDARPGVVLEFPDAVDAGVAKNILQHWSYRHGGAANANKPALLDRGGKASSFAMTNIDAQFIESREFSKGEVASWLNLPPHKVGDLSNATYSNIEQQSIDFVVFSLMPWLLRWQDECNAKLFTTGEINNGSMFAEFLVSALLRGDYNSRMDGHTKALRMGLASIDELRDIENLNPLPDELGSTHYVTLDLAPVGTEPDEDEPVAPPTPPVADDDAAREMLSLLVVGELTRAYQRIGKSATRHATSEERLSVWLRGNLPGECGKIETALEPAIGGAVRMGYQAWDFEAISGQVREDFKKLLTNELDGEPKTLKARVEGLTKRLSCDRPSEIASTIWS